MASIRKRIFESKEAIEQPRPRGGGTILFLLLTALLGGGGYFLAQHDDPLRQVFQVTDKIFQITDYGAHPNRRYEIVYYGTRNCEPCKMWRKTRFEAYKRSDLAQFIGVTTRNSKCGSFGAGASGSIYARTCHALFGQQRGSEKLGFVLIDKQEQRVLSSGRGIEGFDKVVGEAKIFAADLMGSADRPLLPSVDTTTTTSDHPVSASSGDDQTSDPLRNED